MVDGKSQALQQRHLAELEAEGRKMKDQPKEDTPGSGMLAAIAHFDALQAAKKPVIKAEAESGFEKDLVEISHDWVSKWPSTSTSSTIWQFHPHQNKFDKNYPKKVVGLVGVDAVHGHRDMSSFGIAIPSDPSSTFFLPAGGGI